MPSLIRRGWANNEGPLNSFMMILCTHFKVVLEEQCNCSIKSHVSKDAQFEFLWFFGIWPSWMHEPLLRQTPNPLTLYFVGSKDNVQKVGGTRLNKNFDVSPLAFTRRVKRSMELFNFESSKSKNNMVHVATLTQKLNQSSNNKVVNMYQKPHALLH